MADIERELQVAVRHHRARVKVAEEAESRRDLAIRKARTSGLSQARVMAITGLSRQRVNQIVRGVRV